MGDDGGILNNEPEGDGEGGDKTPAPTGVSSAEVKEAIDEGLKEFGTQLGPFITNTVKEQMGSQESDPDPVAPDLSARQMELLNDPESVIDGRAKDAAREVLREEIAPALATTMEGRVEDMFDRARTEVDKTYGEGTFDKEVESDLRTTVNSLTPALRTSTSHFGMVLAGVLGQPAKADLLFDLRTERAKMPDPPEMLGGGMPRPPRKGEITADESDLIAQIASATGVAADPKRYAAVRDGGFTEDDFVFEKETK